MNVLPQAIAKGRNQSGIIAGKLNGVIAATTPTGWRTSSTSTPAGDALEVLALEQVGDRRRPPRPTRSRAATSPRASSSVLPMSSVTRRASSSRCSQSASRSAITARARFCGATARHAGCASRAARDRRVDVGGAGERHQRGQLAGRRVAVLERPVGGRLDPAAADVVAQRASSRFQSAIRVPPVLRLDLGLDVNVLGLLERLEPLAAELAPEPRLLEAAERARRRCRSAGR